MSKKLHWTAKSPEDFQFSVAADYVDQLSEEMERQRLSQKELANRIGVTDGRVSQLFNSPGNLTIQTMVETSRAIGLKLSIVLYDDNDLENTSGPIVSDVFKKCWERCGRPKDWFDLSDDSDGDGDNELAEWQSDQPSIFLIRNNESSDDSSEFEIQDTWQDEEYDLTRRVA